MQGPPVASIELLNTLDSKLRQMAGAGQLSDPDWLLGRDLAPGIGEKRMNLTQAWQGLSSEIAKMFGQIEDFIGVPRILYLSLTAILFSRNHATFGEYPWSSSIEC